MRVVERSYEQSESGYCGVGAIRTALRAIGIAMTEAGIVQKAPALAEIEYRIQKGGIGCQRLLMALRELGVRASPKSKAKWEDLRREHLAGSPIIVEWWSGRGGGEAGSHYSVVADIGKNWIELADPEFGDFYKMKKSDFLGRWRKQGCWMAVIRREE